MKKNAVPAQVMIICASPSFLSDGKTCFGIHVLHFGAVLMFRDILNKNIKVQEMSQLRLSLKYYYIFEVL